MARENLTGHSRQHSIRVGEKNQWGKKRKKRCHRIEQIHPSRHITPSLRHTHRATQHNKPIPYITQPSSLVSHKSSLRLGFPIHYPWQWPPPRSAAPSSPLPPPPPPVFPLPTTTASSSASISPKPQNAATSSRFRAPNRNGVVPLTSPTTSPTLRTCASLTPPSATASSPLELP